MYKHNTNIKPWAKHSGKSSKLCRHRAALKGIFIFLFIQVNFI